MNDIEFVSVFAEPRHSLQIERERPESSDLPRPNLNLPNRFVEPLVCTEFWDLVPENRCDVMTTAAEGNPEIVNELTYASYRER